MKINPARLACAVAAALGFASAALADQTPTFDAKRLSEEVRTLSSDEFEGRAPDTAGETKTVEWIIRHFRDAGLQPGGPKGKDGQRSWTQEVPLLRADIKGPVKASVKSAGETLMLTQGEQIAIRAAMDGSTSVDITDIPLVFLGYGVSAPERQWDDFKGMDLKGKIALVLVNDPDFETGEGDFGGKAMTYYGRWTYKYEEAARRGALGLLVIHETAPASYGWATVKNSNTNTMFDIVRERPSDQHPMIEGWIHRDTTADLFKRAGLDFDVQKKKAQSRDFRPVVLDGTTFSARYDVDAQRIVSHNVIGMVPGSKRPDETVIYSGHWDHLGIGEPDARGDRINNGAIDNATGIAAMVELGRAFAKGERPERSVVFLALTAEEKGLLGSEYYAANPIFPLEKTAGVINMDSLNPWGSTRDFSISGSAKLDLLDDLIAAAKARGRSFTADARPAAGSFFRSDHFPFAKRGVPAVSFSSGRDRVDGGVAAGKAFADAYEKDRYHQPADEWEAQWPFTGMQQDLALLYEVGRALADSDRWPNWSADSEFRAARDASAAKRSPAH